MIRKLFNRLIGRPDPERLVRVSAMDFEWVLPHSAVKADIDSGFAVVTEDPANSIARHEQRELAQVRAGE